MSLSKSDLCRTHEIIDATVGQDTFVSVELGHSKFCMLALSSETSYLHCQKRSLHPHCRDLRPLSDEATRRPLPHFSTTYPGNSPRRTPYLGETFFQRPSIRPSFPFDLFICSPADFLKPQVIQIWTNHSGCTSTSTLIEIFLFPSKKYIP